MLKNCPSLMPALLRLFNTCWSTSSMPSQWKVGVLHLLGKESAKSDPSVPSNFRPIALTSCMDKVYTSVLKGRWMSFMIANGYLNTTVQKAFIDSISGCTEYHVKLPSIVEEAHRKCRALAVCCLDMAKALAAYSMVSSVTPLITTMPPRVAAVSKLYQGFLPPPPRSCSEQRQLRCCLPGTPSSDTLPHKRKPRGSLSSPISGGRSHACGPWGQPKDDCYLGQGDDGEG